MNGYFELISVESGHIDNIDNFINFIIRYERFECILEIYTYMKYLNISIYTFKFIFKLGQYNIINSNEISLLR